jgi:hypothetical protein
VATCAILFLCPDGHDVPRVNGELHLRNKIMVLFSSCEGCLLSCDFLMLQQYIDGPGINLESWTHAEVRCLISYHVAMGATLQSFAMMLPLCQMPSGSYVTASW